MERQAAHLSASGYGLFFALLVAVEIRPTSLGEAILVPALWRAPKLLTATTSVFMIND
jgi:hypothetical protein